MKRQALAGKVIVAAALLTLTVDVLAHQYPAKSVRLIVPFAAGSEPDIQARVLARDLHERFGQAVIVDNRPGASGMLGTQLAAAAAPDGNTMLFTSAVLAISASLYRKRMTFQPLKALEPISWLTTTPLVLITHASLPAHSPAELIEMSRRRPTLFNVAISFPGSISHLSAELFKQLAGLKFTNVSYKSGASSMVAVMGGEVDFHFAQGGMAARQLNTEKVRALAVTSPMPSEFFPGLPTMQSVVPGFVIQEWYAMYFPAGVRAEIVASINGALRNALDTKFVRAFLAGEALTAIGSSPEALDAYLKREISGYDEIIRKGNIMLD